MKYIGLDAGSVSVKLVLLDDKGTVQSSLYQRHKGLPLPVALEMLKTVKGNELCVMGGKDSEPRTPSPEMDFSLSLTGSAGRLIGSILGITPINEVVAYAYATRELYPQIRTIIELGGEDSKLIILGEDSYSPKDFYMNSVCAAGTGSFLDQQAERLRLSIEEFSELSLRSRKPPRIAGRCSVFAKSDMVHLQQIATPVEDIVAGLCFAVARNFKGSIARGRELAFPVSFQGGVAANKGMVRAFKEIFGTEELFVPAEFALMGAIGAAMKDMGEMKKTEDRSQKSEIRDQRHTFDLQKLEDFTHFNKRSEKGYSPLKREGDDFAERHLKDSNELCATGNGLKHKETLKPAQNASPITRHASLPLKDRNALKDEKFPNSSLITHHSLPPLRAWLGVDIGSISTNLALIDDSCRVIARRYLMTAGRPIEAVRLGLEEIYQEVGDRIEITGVGTTGSGRYMIADYIGADIVKNEITAQATAAAFIDKDVDTIFEIGGQDSKYISLKNGVVVDFEMNKACAAGTGSFLEEQAEKLGISIKGEFQESAFDSQNPCRLGERCTVFMENSLMSNLQSGTDKKDLLAGLAYSIVQNYINRVVCKRPIGKRIFFQGGVAFNKSVVAAFEKYLGRQIIVPPDHDVTGAIGMALIAKEYMNIQGAGVRSQNTPSLTLPPRGGGMGGGDDSELRTAFKGFELSRRAYDISSFECKGCSNVCEINKIRIEGEKGHLFYGGRCEKYDVRKKKQENKIPDLFAFRNEMLWKAHNDRKALCVKSNESKNKNYSLFTIHYSPKIGIPYIFYFQDYLPFWTTLLWELGFEVEVSPETDGHIIDTGMETVLAETCFPVKVAHGHIKYLLDKGVDTLLIPSFVNLNKTDDPFDAGFACPYTQTIPYMAKTAFQSIKALTPIVDMNQGEAFLRKELKRIFKPYNIGTSQISRAFRIAQSEQENFIKEIKDKGHEIISSLKERAVVIAGRAYNSFDKGVNLDIPKKLADLGVISLPMDFLPVEHSPVNQDWPNMYWRAGQRILSAAKIIRANPLLHAVYIGNFSCGPDSFIIKFFDEEMSGKPYLHLELDAHSADAGAVTRCEAFLDSIQNQVQSSKFKVQSKRTISHHSSLVTRHSKRTIFMPRMSDHSFAVAAAFEYCGIAAEVLPESTSETVDIGKKYVSGKECYPCAVTTGDMVKKIMEPGFDPDKSAFFMPSGSGPCRFGQYNVFHRLVIKNLGLDNVPVFSPNQNENFYKHLKIAGKGFAMRSWEGITAIGLLQKCLHQTRPYEKEKNISDEIYIMHRQKAYDALRGANGGIKVVLKKARIDFENIPRYKDKRPLIGIVGEIFVRSNRFSNEDLARKIEGLGGEAYLAPASEWIYYINLMALRRVLIKKDWSGMITLLSKRFFQKRTEHKFERYFAGFLKSLHEPDTREILDKALPYIHPSFEGEAILSIGKSLELIEKGASGIINAMPFGCMPGTIVNWLMRGLKREYGIPCLSIPYDGTESLTTEIQLEAFMDQAREYRKK